MILTKEVEVKLHGRNIKYYEDLGYEIPRYPDINDKMRIKRGTIIVVKIEDLYPESAAIVSVQCDGICHQIKTMRYLDYLKYIKKDGKYHCLKCKRENSIKKGRKTKLLKSKSFNLWCIENHRKDILNRWDYDLNCCHPSDVFYSENKKYWFKCPKETHNSELKSINGFTNNHVKDMSCKQCNSFAQYLIDLYGENALELYWDFEKNIDINPWGIIKGGATKVWIKCQEKDYHGSYFTTCNKILQGYRCSYCGNRKVYILDSLGNLYSQTLELWSNLNIKTPYEYSFKSKKEVFWKCNNNKHKDYLRSIEKSTNSDFRCPECVRERDESFLQEKVRLYLNNLGYASLHEYNCNLLPISPKTKMPLPYDNEIIDLKLIIEVHGEQHYKITTWNKRSAKNHNTTPEYEYNKIKIFDRYKRIFAKKQGYFYLEIPYWTDDKEGTWRKLIDDKISEIKIY